MAPSAGAPGPAMCAGAPGPAMDPAVEQFLAKNRIQPHAADSFRALPPELQHLVHAAGSLDGARDPTAVLISRMSKARQGLLQPAGQKAAQAPVEYNLARSTDFRGYAPSNTAPVYPQGGVSSGGVPSRVDAFLLSNNIEAHAVDTFRSLPPELQSRVMDAGSLSDARDPTAVLISRMNKARNGTLKASQPGDWQCPACGDLNMARNPVCRSCVARSGEEQGMDSFGGFGRGAGYTGHPSAGKALSEAENFLRNNAVDVRATETFLNLPPSLQRQVMDCGSLADARDPTAVLVSRMNKARAGTLAPSLPGKAPGGYSERPNGSAFSGGSRGFTSEFEGWLEQNRIEPAAVDTFRTLPPQMQRLVVDAGSLADARDPTAVLVSRMNKARQGTLKAAQAMPGDWTCRKCGELNFARNYACRSCGAPFTGTEERRGDSSSASRGGRGGLEQPPPRSLGASVAPPSSLGASVAPPSSLGGPAKRQAEDDWYGGPASQKPRRTFSDSPDIEEYLQKYRIEGHAAEMFRSLPPDMQTQVMTAGSLADARDPTAVIMSRMRKAQDGTLKPIQTGPGDWNCSYCGELNFARNSSCRQCGAPAPGGNPYGRPGSAPQGGDRAYRGSSPPRGDDRAYRRPSPPRGDDRIYGRQSPRQSPPRGDDRAYSPYGDDRAYPPRGDDRAYSPYGDDRAYPPRGDDRAYPPRGDDRAYGRPGALRGDDRVYGRQSPPRGDDRAYGRPSASQGGDHGYSRPIGSALHGDGRPPSQVEEFIRNNMIEAHAVDTFRTLPPDMQYLVMSAGSLSDARDPTAVLISRMNKARQGTLRPPQKKVGDWTCSKCGDHNFARNTHCRSCGTPNRTRDY
eukprot:TRINITY_DN6286_c0_g1_i1.p1 TRINITY_DN6286_c0_g1~~TRINITY_DN6286_c0_g1_i1.p1  ORF type:complete len:896 (+),score=116.45 TRINITY_DN6286_c0_g1_i1:130-2688(+)